MNGSFFTQLNAFLAITREGSISAAARKLEVSPPSVSQALKQLEETMGLTLLNRTTRSIELTEAGQRLMEESSPAMQRLATAIESVQSLSTTPRGQVSITVPRTVFKILLEPVYAEFCREYEEIRLEVSINNAMVDIIKEGFDAGIRLGHLISDSMVAHSLTPPIREALFASPEYLKQWGRPERPADLYQHRLIQYRYMFSNQLAPLQLTEGGETLRVEAQESMIVNDNELMIDAARKGVGIGRVLEPAVRDDFDTGKLVPILREYWFQYPGLHIYFSKNSQKARRLRVFIDFLRDRVPEFWEASYGKS